MLLRSYIFDIPEFLINYFPYVNLSSIELFTERLKLLQRIFVIQSVSRDLNHSQGGRGGGRVIYLGILSNVKIFRESFTQDDKV